MTGNGHQPATTYEVLRGRVQERIAGLQLDTDREPERIRQLIRTVVGGYQHESASGVGGRPLSDTDQMAGRLEQSVLGYGPFAPFVDTGNPPVEVKVRGAFVTWKDEFGRWHTSEEPTTEEELLHAVMRLLEPTGRQLSEAQPIVSTQVLGLRARLTASIPPVSDVLEVNLRFYRLVHVELVDLLARDTITQAAMSFLWALMRHPRVGVLVSGPPQAGKTTMVNALLRAVPNSHEVCVVEDTRELNAPLMQISFRRTRPRTGLSDDESEITLRDLVALALRSSPTRIVVGEVRGSEAVELTRASDAGAAMLATLHAHSAADALDALSNAALLGDHQLSPEIVRATFARNVDVVVHLESEDVELRGNDHRHVRRQVMEIAAVSPLQGGESRFTTIPVFTREDIGAPLVPTGHPLPARLNERLGKVLARYGTTLGAVLDGGEVIRE
jgi:pilus assembly protein CpaF